jgi:hypothetical protein
MKDELEKLTDQELENLLTLQFQRLHLTKLYEWQFLERMSRRDLEIYRDEILDRIVNIQKIQKKRQKL